MSIVGFASPTVAVERTGGRPAGAAQEGDAIQKGTTLNAAIDDRSVRMFGVGLVLAIAWSASIGGLGTLLGSPPNAIVAGYVAEELGESIGFVEWMQLGVALVVAFILIAWLLITRVLYRNDLEEIPGGKEMIAQQLHDLGPMTRGEKTVHGVFSGAAFLWIVPGLLTEFAAVAEAAPWLGEFNDTAIAIAAGIVLFLLPAERGRMVLNWDDAQKGLPWGVLLLFGGGLALAAAVAASGLDAWIGAKVEPLGALPLVLLVAAVVTLVLFRTEITRPRSPATPPQRPPSSPSSAAWRTASVPIR